MIRDESSHNDFARKKAHKITERRTAISTVGTLPGGGFHPSMGHAVMDASSSVSHTVTKCLSIHGNRSTCFAVNTVSNITASILGVGHLGVARTEANRAESNTRSGALVKPIVHRENMIFVCRQDSQMVFGAKRLSYVFSKNIIGAQQERCSVGFYLDDFMVSSFYQAPENRPVL